MMILMITQYKMSHREGEIKQDHTRMPFCYTNLYCYPRNSLRPFTHRNQHLPGIIRIREPCILQRSIQPIPHIAHQLIDTKARNFVQLHFISEVHFGLSFLYEGFGGLVQTLLGKLDLGAEGVGLDGAFYALGLELGLLLFQGFLLELFVDLFALD